MQLNKTLKALMVALPVMTLAACSSSSSVDEGAANESNRAATTESNTVDVNTMSREKSAEEKLREKI